MCFALLKTILAFRILFNAFVGLHIIFIETSQQNVKFILLKYFSISKYNKRNQMFT